MTYRKNIKSAEGSITVFLSLTLTSMIALLGGLYTSARSAGCGWYAKVTLDSALDSMMSCYHREAFDRYKVFLLEYDTAEGLAQEMTDMADVYYQAAPWYELADRQLDVTDVYGITDLHGELFEKEICDYMKTAIFDSNGSNIDVASLAEEMKEAETLGDVAASYQNDGRAVMNLARIVDKISAALEAARENIHSAEDFLQSGNVGRFDIELGKAKRQLEKIPGLIEKYRSEAEKSGEQLRLSDSFRESKLLDMSDDGKEFTDSQSREYHQYVDKDGTYYLRVMSLEGFSDLGISILDRAADLADEISNEPCDCDEDEDCDCEPDYSPVFPILDEYHSPSGFAVMEKDKSQIKEWQEQLAQLNGDLLPLILPPKTVISKDAIKDDGLPSLRLSTMEDTETKKSLLEGMAVKAVMVKYNLGFFPNFMTADRFAGEYPYAQEYIVSGKPRARDSLRGAVDRIAAIRMAVNYVDSLRDPVVTDKASKLAALASGGTPLAAVIYFLVIGAWAAVETTYELTRLMAGEKVAFTDKSSLELSYEDYLVILMYLTNREKLDYRMMDMMQTTIRKNQDDFRMSACAARIEANISGQGPVVELKRHGEREY